MQSVNGKDSLELNKKGISGTNNNCSSLPGESESDVKEDTDVSSSADGTPTKPLVYDPQTNGGGEIVHAPTPLNSHPASLSKKELRVLPAVGAFTVQCAKCYQWRLIPTKEKYEEIRENITENPFFCEAASEWRPGVSCDDLGDIQQDNTRLWAIDKPNIVRPPPGWQRLLHIRGEGSSKFADVYYVAPSGKRFRSLVEIHKYFVENPELTAGFNVSQFSFQIPKPLQEDYVKKRPCGMRSLRALEADEVSPIAWPNLGDNSVGDPSPSSFETPLRNTSDQPAKKQKKSSTQGNNISSS